MELVHVMGYYVTTQEPLNGTIKMDDLERRLERIKTRADNLEDLPMVSKIAAARMMFTDTQTLLADMMAHIKNLEGKAHG